MKLTSRFAVCAAVSAAVLLAGAVTSLAQQAQSSALSLAYGNGVTGTPGEGLRTFSFSLVELSNGSLRGHGVIHDQADGGWLRFEITSYMVVDDILLMAGPITAVHGEGVPPGFFVGATFFFAVRDGGDGRLAIDEISSANAAPIPGLTIDEILALLCSMNPSCDPDGPIVLPPDVVLPITAGNIKVFYENL
ncbi:MAG: hypothetical protein ACYTGG_05050 [Planctomycetota bacterium]|jgi:hypothetical protein